MTATGRVVVVGDAFLDVDWSADAPGPVLGRRTEVSRPGGAALAAVCAAEAGAAVTLITALGDDDEGREIRAQLRAAGVDVLDLGLRGGTPVKLRLRSGDRSVARVDRNCSPVAGIGPWPDEASRSIRSAGAVLVSDDGRGMTSLPGLASALVQMEAVPVVWDPHPRGATPPQRGLDVLTPNLVEARRLVGGAGPSGIGDTLQAAERLVATFGCAAAVTVGDQGAVLAEPGAEPLLVPVEPVSGDPCGAGDRFAATVAVERSRGVGRPAAVGRAVEAACRHVREAASSDGDGRGDAAAVVRAVHQSGGTVVVAGGCFDVLHAGHIRLLEAARRLGDCLVVCLDSDGSVRRRKGHGRPINPLPDRIAVLRSLRCVDAVEVVAEDTPVAALQALRPDVFVTGADHATDFGPERAALAAWGGCVVLVPLMDGRSTTTIVQAAATGEGPLMSPVPGVDCATAPSTR